MQHPNARAGGRLSLNNTIAAEVRAELGRRNLSQAQLAVRLGWTQVRLSRRLRSVSDFSTAELEQISDALGVPIAHLLAEAS
jgi:transcriptional regulator with XRE-family HTH domain